MDESSNVKGKQVTAERIGLRKRALEAYTVS